MTSEFMKPAPRWITLPGDPQALRQELAERRHDNPDNTPQEPT